MNWVLPHPLQKVQAVLRGIGEGIRPLSMGYLLQWQMFSSFWEMVFASGAQPKLCG